VRGKARAALFTVIPAKAGIHAFHTRVPPRTLTLRCFGSYNDVSRRASSPWEGAVVQPFQGPDNDP
jgi:hypothetical protein